MPDRRTTFCHLAAQAVAELVGVPERERVAVAAFGAELAAAAVEDFVSAVVVAEAVDFAFVVAAAAFEVAAAAVAAAAVAGVQVAVAVRLAAPACLHPIRKDVLCCSGAGATVLLFRLR